MHQATQAVPTLIHLHGLDFSHDHVNCPNCSWEGEAGHLLAPINKDLKDSVAYSCPQCHASIATHDGFSSAEIRKEIHAIRNLITEVKAIRAS